MNYIKHLSTFFELVEPDKRINPSHISLYMALFQYWNINRFNNPVSISRTEIMRLSKIGSFHTFYRCMYDLHSFGFIKYEPSHNSIKGSLVHLCIFDTSTAQAVHHRRCKNDTSTAQAVHHRRCKNDTSTAQAVHPSINYINNTNINREREENKNSHSHNSEILKFDFFNENLKDTIPAEKKSKRKKVPAKKEKRFSPPDETQVIDFFKSEHLPEKEARKFFNHFQSNGWKVSGKTPMKDWQAAARKWMLNMETPKYNPIKVTNNKIYGKPL